MTEPESCSVPSSRGATRFSQWPTLTPASHPLSFRPTLGISCEAPSGPGFVSFIRLFDGLVISFRILIPRSRVLPSVEELRRVITTADYQGRIACVRHKAQRT